MRRNNHRKLSAISIFHQYHAKNVGIIGILAKEGGREGYRGRVREIKGNRELRDGE